MNSLSEQDPERDQRSKTRASWLCELDIDLHPRPEMRVLRNAMSNEMGKESFYTRMNTESVDSRTDAGN